MNDIDRIIAIEEIKQLKARYFRYVDTKDWESYRGIFVPDVHFDMSEAAGGISNRAEEAVEVARTSLIDCVSVHHGHCPEIEILSDSEARAIWAMEDMLRWSSDSAYPGQTLHGYGHYFETYEKRDGRWLIKSVKLTRLRCDVQR